MPEVFITCAVTGAGDTVGKSDKVPFTPEAIASDVIAAANAGAAIAHIHVRDPITGEPDRQIATHGDLAIAIALAAPLTPTRPPTRAGRKGYTRSRVATPPPHFYMTHSN